MSIDRFILNKFFRDECTPEEYEQVLKWVNSFKFREDFEKEFFHVWTNSKIFTDFNWEKALEELNARIEMNQLIHHLKINPEENDHVNIQKHVKKNWHLRYAAAFVFILIAAITLVEVFLPFKQPVEQATLVEQLTKSTEPGQKLTIQLEDGSRVILNSGSKLIYPRIFSDNSRELELVGEAFFEVAGDSLRPFTIISGSLYATVLGTSFNVKAYPDQDVYEVALANGRLRVHGSNPKVNVILESGEKASYDIRNEELSTGKADPMLSFAWKNGIIFFKNADFPEIKSILERWYGVEIFVEGERSRNHWHFSGKFENEDLKNILEILKFSYGFEYTLEKKQVRLKF